MNISNFFKILNYKIEKYNQMAQNPFTSNHPIILIWVEDESKKFENNKEISRKTYQKRV